MKRLLLVLVVLACFTEAGLAQTPTVIGGKIVTTCGTQSLTVGGSNVFYMDATGNLCTNASGGSTSTVTDAGVGTTTDATCTAGGVGSLNCKERLMTTLQDSINTLTTAIKTNSDTLAGVVSSAKVKNAYGDGTSMLNTDVARISYSDGTSLLSTDVADVNLKNCGGSACSASAPLFVTPTPSATGGWSTFNATAADGATACTNTAQAVKASQGTFGGYFINNPNTSDEWLQVYNTAAGSVTVGTTNPALTFRISGAAANSVGANLEITLGAQFGTAISIACTSTAGGNGAPANALEADIFYK